MGAESYAGVHVSEWDWSTVVVFGVGADGVVRRDGVSRLTAMTSIAGGLFWRYRYLVPLL